MYNVIYNNSAGKKTIHKYQRTEEFMRKVQALLYYVHMNAYNWINFKIPRVIIMHFYRLIRFHIRRRFCTRLSVRVSNSGQPVTYTRQFCTNKTGHKIYHCMPAGYTWHYILLHNTTIIHTNKFIATACHPRKKILSDKNCNILHCYTHGNFTRHCPLL